MHCAVAVPDQELAPTAKSMKSLQMGILLLAAMLPEYALSCTKVTVF